MQVYIMFYNITVNTEYSLKDHEPDLVRLNTCSTIKHM